jgi:hypothetical protein
MDVGANIDHHAGSFRRAQRRAERVVAGAEIDIDGS